MTEFLSLINCDRVFLFRRPQRLQHSQIGLFAIRLKLKGKLVLSVSEKKLTMF